MGSMSHWAIEKGENDVEDALSAVYQVVYNRFGSHALRGL